MHKKENLGTSPASKTTPAMEVKSFSKRYKGRPNYAVRDVSFTVHQGEFHGFIGANGAGKTTTIKSLIGAYANYEGDVSFFGMKNTSKEAKLKLGYIPEAANFPKRMSALSYIRYMANLGGMSWMDSRHFAFEKLKEVGLGHLMRKSPNSFSSGQKKKVLLAQALVSDPDIIVMDEPAANLDPQARTEFFNVLKELQGKGKAIFISSHILSELEKYVTHVTILDGGKLAYSGDVNTLTKSNTNQYVITLETIEDLKIVEAYFKAEKITNSKNDKTITFEIKDKKDFLEINKFLVSKKVFFLSLHTNKKTLDDVYNEYVQKGSVDTKGEDIKRRGNGVQNA